MKQLLGDKWCQIVDNPPICAASESKEKSESEVTSVDASSLLTNRVTELELRWMQVQQDFDALNTVVIEQRQELDAIRAILSRFETRLDGLSDPEPPRDPLAERPPHY